MKKHGLIIWSILRLPILAAGLYLFWRPLFEFVKARIELRTIIDFAVYSANTFETRFDLYLITVISMALGYWLVKQWLTSDVRGYFLMLAGMLAVIFISFQFLLLTPNAAGRTLIVFLVLAVNSMPMEWLARGISGSRMMNFVFLSAVGLSEAFFPQAYVFWLMDKFQMRNSIKQWSWMGGVLVAPLFWLFLLTPYNNQRILTLGEKLHTSPAVEKFAAGEYNWIEFDADLHQIFVSGNRSNFLLAFDTENLNLPPRKSEDIRKMQSFAYNPERKEMYAYEADTNQLLYIDAVTLDTVRSVPVTDLSPGDVWVKWHRSTDTIIISSEADFEVGTPFYIVARESGEVVGSMPLPIIPTAYLVFHPEKPLLYFNSYRDTYLIAWDMISHETVLQTQTSANTDRMEFDEKRNELLVASPLDGAILRYDADTLEYRGKIKVGFGVRTLTIDTQRDLLVVGNFINDRIQVIDMSTYDRVSSFYLGPWVRTITLDVENGIAYVSTVRNLFKVYYISK